MREIERRFESFKGGVPAVCHAKVKENQHPNKEHLGGMIPYDGMRRACTRCFVGYRQIMEPTFNVDTHAHVLLTLICL